jgi:hypothetical protein
LNHTQQSNPSSLLGRSRLDNVVNDGIEEYSSNSNSTSDELQWIQRFAEDDGNSNDDDDTFGGVGYGLGYGVL